MSRFIGLTLAACGLVPAFASAAAIVHAPNQILTAGGPAINAIDPAGDENKDTDAANATPEATLNALTELRVQQDFDTADSTEAEVHTFYWTGTDLPDYRLTYSGTRGFLRGLNAHGNTPARRTSGNRSMDLDVQTNNGESSAVFTLTFDFGSYDPDANSFSTTANPVRVAGLMLLDVAGSTSVTTRFFDAANNVLSTQTASGAAEATTGGNGTELYFGFQSLTHNIDRFEVAITHNGTFREQYGIDDVFFSTVIIPEPAVSGLIAMLAIPLAGRRR